MMDNVVSEAYDTIIVSDNSNTNIAFDDDFFDIFQNESLQLVNDI